MLDWSGVLWFSWFGVAETVGPSLPRIFKNVIVRFVSFVYKTDICTGYSDM